MAGGGSLRRKSIKIVAIRCHISKVKCTKFDFGWGFAPDPTGELIDPLNRFKGPTPTSKEKEKMGSKWEIKGGIRGEGEENGDRPPTIFGLKVALVVVLVVLVVVVVVVN